MSNESSYMTTDILKKTPMWKVHRWRRYSCDYVKL